MPLKLDHYDPDQRIKDRAQKALFTLGLIGRNGPVPETPDDDGPVRAALAKQRYRARARLNLNGRNP